MGGLDIICKVPPDSFPEVLGELEGKQVLRALVAIHGARHEEEVRANERAHGREGNGCRFGDDESSA